MTPAEKLGKKVIGTIKVRNFVIKGHALHESTGTGRTFEVIEITKAGDITVYIANMWYSEHNNKPLQVPEQFVETFTPAIPGATEENK